jgi:hypothetical protein
MSKLAQDRHGGPLLSHLTGKVLVGEQIHQTRVQEPTFTLRILQASQAFRSLVLWSIRESRALQT